MAGMAHAARVVRQSVMSDSGADGPKNTACDDGAGRGDAGI